MQRGVSSGQHSSVVLPLAKGGSAGINSARQTSGGSKGAQSARLSCEEGIKGAIPAQG